MNQVKRFFERFQAGCLEPLGRVWSRQTPQMRRQAIITVAVIVGVGLAQVMRVMSSPKPTPIDVPPPRLMSPTAPPAPSAKELAEPHLLRAESACREEIDAALADINAAFDSARSQTRAYASEALGWNSKWTYVNDCLWGTSDHEQFLMSKFEEMVLSSVQLETLIQECIARVQSHAEAVESQMLIDLRADLEGFVECPLTAAHSSEELQRLFAKSLAMAQSAAVNDVSAAVGREVVSLVAGEVLSHVAIQLGVNAGILGSGAASGWATFGVGLVAGIVVDEIVTLAYDAYADPTGELARTINAQLERMRHLIVEGSDEHPGLRRRLEEYLQRRASLRNAAVLQLLETVALADEVRP